MSESEKKGILDNYSDVLTTVLHTGRTLTYKMLKEGTIKSVRAGRRYIIPKKYLEEFLNAEKSNEK